LESARATDPLTLKIKTKTPTLILPSILAGVRIPAPSYMDQLIEEDPNALPVGTGPFAVTAWNSDRIYLDAHTAGWRAPKTDKMEFILVPERTARVQATIAGNIHIAFGLGAEDTLMLEGTGHSYHSMDAGGVVGLSFVNVKEGPIQNQKVRQALNYAVNKQAYIDVLLHGKTRPASQATPSIAYGFDPDLEPYPYDPDRARTLLAEAGYADGFDLVMEGVIEGSTSGSEIWQYVASQLADVGVNLEIRTIPISELIRKAVNGGFAGGAFGMDFDTNPTLDAMRPFPMHSCLRRVPWYCDPMVVPWIEEAQTTFDPERRLVLLRKILGRYRESPPMLFLHETIHFEGLNKSVRNYAPRPSLANYHEVELVE
jgi:peptide/nickel transport system substrate-binding protein